MHHRIMGRKERESKSEIAGFGGLNLPFPAISNRPESEKELLLNRLEPCSRTTDNISAELIEKTIREYRRHSAGLKGKMRKRSLFIIVFFMPSDRSRALRSSLCCKVRRWCVGLPSAAYFPIARLIHSRSRCSGHSSRWRRYFSPPVSSFVKMRPTAFWRGGIILDYRFNLLSEREATRSLRILQKLAKRLSVEDEDCQQDELADETSVDQIARDLREREKYEEHQ